MNVRDYVKKMVGNENFDDFCLWSFGKIPDSEDPLVQLFEKWHILHGDEFPILMDDDQCIFRSINNMIKLYEKEKGGNP